MSVHQSEHSEMGEKGSYHSWDESNPDPAGAQKQQPQVQQKELSKIEETGLSATEKSYSQFHPMPSSIMPGSEMRIEENLLGEDTLCMIHQEGEEPADIHVDISNLDQTARKSSGQPDEEAELSDHQVIKFTDEYNIEGFEAVKSLEGGPFGYITLCRTPDHKYFFLKKGLALGWSQISALRQLTMQGEYLMSPNLIAAVTGTYHNMPFLDIHNAIIPAQIDWESNISLQTPSDTFGKTLAPLDFSKTRTVFRPLFFVNPASNLRNLLHHRLSHDTQFQEFEILDLVLAFSEAMKNLEKNQRKHNSINLETILVDYEKHDGVLRFFILDPDFIVPAYSTTWLYIKGKKCYPSPELLTFCHECNNTADITSIAEHIDSQKSDIFSFGLILLEIVGGGEEPSYLSEETNKLDMNLIAQKFEIAEQKYSENLMNLIKSMLSEEPNLRPSSGWLKMRVDQLLQAVSLSRMQSPLKSDENQFETRSNPEIKNLRQQNDHISQFDCTQSLQLHHSDKLNMSDHEKSELGGTQAKFSTNTWGRIQRASHRIEQCQTGELGQQSASNPSLEMIRTAQPDENHETLQQPDQEGQPNQEQQQAPTEPSPADLPTNPTLQTADQTNLTKHYTTSTSTTPIPSSSYYRPTQSSPPHVPYPYSYTTTTTQTQGCQPTYTPQPAANPQRTLGHTTPNAGLGATAGTNNITTGNTHSNVNGTTTTGTSSSTGAGVVTGSRVVSVKRYLLRDGQRILIDAQYPDAFVEGPGVCAGGVGLISGAVGRDTAAGNSVLRGAETVTIVSGGTVQGQLGGTAFFGGGADLARGRTQDAGSREGSRSQTRGETVFASMFPSAITGGAVGAGLATVEVIKPRKQVVHSLAALQRSVSPQGSRGSQSKDLFTQADRQHSPSAGWSTKYQNPQHDDNCPQYFGRQSQINHLKVNCSTCLKNLRREELREQERSDEGKFTNYSTRRGNSPSTHFSRSPPREGSPRARTRFCALDASEADVIDAGPKGNNTIWKPSPKSKPRGPSRGDQNRMIYGDLYYDHHRKICDEVCRKFPESIKPAKRQTRIKPSEWPKYSPDTVLQEFARKEIEKLKAREKQQQEYQRLVSRYGYTPGRSDAQASPAAPLDDSYL